MKGDRNLQENRSSGRKKEDAKCCSWFCTKRRSSSFVPELLDTNEEVYDYIVEKLTIRRVPLSLFATREDLIKREQHLSRHPFVTCEMEKPGAAAVLSLQQQRGPSPVMFPFDRRSSATLNNVKCIPKRDHQSRTELTAEKGLGQDEETILVSEILNKHSSLFTLDPKETVPKDPDRPSRNTIVIPERIRTVFDKKQRMFSPVHETQVQVDVHRMNDLPSTSVVKAATKHSPSPTLQQTIEALKFVQRPRTPGFPPRNQRTMPGRSLTLTTEREISCNVLGGDRVTEKDSSREMVCHLLQPTEHSDNKPIETKRNTSIADHKLAGALTSTDDEIGSKILPRHDTDGVAGSASKDQEHITEIKQLKGQRLKWKIIIKHHSNKEKEVHNNSIRSGESDSESESKSSIST